jgi:hypothetical protein
VGLLLAAVAILVATMRERRRDNALGAGPDHAGDRIERCLICHDAAEESPGGPHSAAALGCSSCHLGNSLAFDRDRAHAGMEPHPGALGTVWRSCGQGGCHEREASRVLDSLMASARGIVAVDRWVFGEIDSPDGTQSISDVLASASPSPAESHLGKLCGGCHLHAATDNRDDAIRTIGEGCSSCHASKSANLGHHSRVDSRIDDDRCLGCHSRSGRIALSYQGLAEIEADQVGECEQPATLHDGRNACRLSADVHHEKGLACIDCHLHTDLMGDGGGHLHKEEQVEITCEGCHDPRTNAEQAWHQVDDPITTTILRMNEQERAGAELVRRGRRGTPLWNLRPAQSGWLMIGKVSGTSMQVTATPRDANHTLVGHRRLTCTACHSTWAPTCTTCHTELDDRGRQWSFAAAAVTDGAWKETSGGYSWAPPTLAVTAVDQIVAAIPGMVMTMRSIPGKTTSHRLYAQIDAHTTRREARSCDSCHRSSTALGLGQGQLDLTASPPTFTPANPESDDPGLARDRWTELGAEQPAPGTRQGLRSLDADEQSRVLRVGQCTPCHPQADDRIYADFSAAQTRMSSRCQIR